MTAIISTASLDVFTKSRLIELLLSLSQQNEENKTFIAQTIQEWTTTKPKQANNTTQQQQQGVSIREGKSTKKERVQMSKYRQRTIAIQLQYEGGSYFGFSSQPGECDDTIEKHLFEALTKLKYIESRQV
jgi:uncharacterized membrane protein YheB (UPF0754 family)